MSTLRCDQNGLETGRFPSSWIAQRIYYGWVMLAIATLAAICTSPAQTYGIAAFNDSFRADLSLSHSQLAGAYMLGTLLAALPMSYIGGLADRFGLKRMKTVVVILLAVACAITASAFSIVSLFFAFFLLRMFGQGALSMLSGNTLAFWFERRLGTVEGIRHFGIAGAIAIVPTFNLWLIDSVGWRLAYLLLGLTVLLLMLPLLLLFFHDHPEHVGQRKDNEPEPDPDAALADDPLADDRGFTLKQAMRTRAFWIVGGGWALWGMANTAFVFNALPLLQDRGLGGADAAVLFTIFGVALACMHLVGGMLADRVPLAWLFTFGVAGIGLTMFLMSFAADRTMVIATGVSMGVTQGLLAAVLSPLWPRYYGRRHLGSIRGSLATITVASTASGPYLMGLTRDLTGSYEPALLFFAATAAAIALLAPFATRPAAKPA